LTDQLMYEYSKLENKVRFITEIISNKLKVQNRKKADLIAELKSKKYDVFAGNRKEESSNNQDDDQESNDEQDADGGFDYLLSMQIWNLTWERVEQLKRQLEEKQAELDYIISLTPKQMWEIDLDDLILEINQIEKSRLENEKSSIAGKRNPGKGKKKAAKLKDEDDYDDEDFKYKPSTGRKGKRAPKIKTETKTSVKREPSFSISIKKEEENPVISLWMLLRSRR